MTTIESAKWVHGQEEEYLAEYLGARMFIRVRASDAEHAKRIVAWQWGIHAQKVAVTKVDNRG
jgi:hypothetical protein